MQLTLSNRWAKTLQARVESFEFEVGILDDKEHRNPQEAPLHTPPSLGNYAGGPVRRMGKGTSGKTSEVFIANEKRMNTNLLWEPFQKKNDEILKFTKSFLELVVKKNLSVKRVENLLQAIVRNPILRLEYGKNTPHTADGKGFDRHLFDTGQMFKAIKARVKRV